MEPTPILSSITQLSKMDEIKPLLLQCGLPVSDISLCRHQFFGIRSGKSLVAVIGLEPLGSVGLLRSLAIAPARRHLGLARQLVFHVECMAADEGVAELYLLTTTASAFFNKLGYQYIHRTVTPMAIQSTSQFSELCSSSSDLLYKRLGFVAVSSEGNDIRA